MKKLIWLLLLLASPALADVAVKGKNGTTVDATANGLKVDATISSGANVTITGLPAVTQGTSPWVTQDNHTTAVAPLSCRLTDGASFYSLGAGLTDAQLRATPVPVSGSVTATVASTTVTNTVAVKASKVSATTLATAVSVTTSATALPAAALANRVSLCVYNNGASTIFLGHSAVTTSSGLPVAAGGSFCDDVGAQVYYAVVAAGTVDVRVLEN